MLLAGVDEAGRGPIIGNLVMAGVAVPSEEAQKLVSAGAKDSKLLSPYRRETVYRAIRSMPSVKVSVVKFTPREIDGAVEENRLNYLEAKGMAAILSDLRPEKAILDCPDPVPSRYEKMVLERLAPGSITTVIAEHHADLNHPIVGAASIIAKVERDADIAKLASVYGDIGSGYPSDGKTVAFLAGWLASRGEKPEFARKSWATWKRIERMARR